MQHRSIHELEYDSGFLRSAHYRAAGIPDRRGSPIHVVHQPDHRFRFFLGSNWHVRRSAVYLALNTSLQYQLRHALLSATYSHGVTGGSGVLAGAETNVALGTVSGQVTRKVQAMWNAGYSRNEGFAVGTSSASQIYNYWFTGVNLSRTIGRSLDMFMNYEFQYQDNSASGCVGTACSTGT